MTKCWQYITSTSFFGARSYFFGSKQYGASLSCSLDLGAFVYGSSLVLRVDAARGSEDKLAFARPLFGGSPPHVFVITRV